MGESHIVTKNVVFLDFINDFLQTNYFIPFDPLRQWARRGKYNLRRTKTVIFLEFLLERTAFFFILGTVQTVDCCSEFRLLLLFVALHRYNFFLITIGTSPFVSGIHREQSF